MIGWGAVAAFANRRWYAGLVKPAFAPDPWLAGSLFAASAVALGGAVYAVLRCPDYHPDRSPALRAVWGAAALAAAWIWAFFAGRHPTLSLALAASLVAASLWALRRAASVGSGAALLLVPWTLAAILTALVDLAVRLRNG